MDANEFADRQLELTAEFGKFIFDHPEMDDQIPNGAHVYFEVTGEPEFNRHGRRLAEKHLHKNGTPVIIFRIKGLAPAQGSRLVDPVVQRLLGGG